jgi:hypothetical protein
MKPADFDAQTYIHTVIMNITVIRHPTELEYLKQKGPLPDL